MNNLPYKRLMTRYVLAALLGSGLGSGAAVAGVTFIGEGSLPGNAVDQSGLTDLLEDGASEPTRFFAFAIDHGDLPALQPQLIGAGWNPGCRTSDSVE